MIKRINIKNRIEITSIAAIILIWTFSNIATPIDGIVNGVYFACILTSIYLFKDNVKLAIIVTICSQIMLVAAGLLRGLDLNNAVAEFSITLTILSIAFVYYIIKHKEGKLEIRNTNVYTKIILYSLIIITTLSITATDRSYIVPILFTTILPLVITITLALRVKDYYLNNGIYAIVGLYVCFMQYSIGQSPHIMTLTFIIILLASVNKYIRFEN